MKKFSLIAITALMLLFVPIMVQAVQSLEDTRIARPAPTSEESSGCQNSLFTASGITSAFKNAVKDGLASVNQKIVTLKKAIEDNDTKTATAIAKKDTATAKSIDALSGKIDQQGRDFKTFDDKLTGKGGQFAKTNAKIDAVDSSILWMAAAVIIILGLLGMLGFSLIKKALNRVEKKIDKTPEKTAEAVHEYFNPKPFEWDLNGEHIVYEFPTDDKCYTTFKVVNTNGSTNPAYFEQQILSSGHEAKKYCMMVFRNFRAGKLTGTSEEALINYLINTTKKIKISKI